MIAIGHRPRRDTETARTLQRFGERLGGYAQSRDEEVSTSARGYMQWGWKLTPGLLSCMKQRKPYLILDHGYLEPRAEKFSISINGFHGRGLRVDTSALPEVTGAAPAPWSLDGDTVYVIGQMQNDRAVRGVDIARWMDWAVHQSRDMFPGKRVIRRPHPGTINPWEPPLPPLESVFDDAYLVVTLTSSVGPQALMAGCPTVAYHDASMCRPLVPSELRRVCPRGRTDWARDLRQREFGVDELDRACRFVVHCWQEAESSAAKGCYDTQGLRV